MSRLGIALMIAILLVIGIAGNNERNRKVDCERSDDQIECLLRKSIGE